MEFPNEQQKQQPSDLLHAFLPPRLEDAGLEDCALPPDAIKQAFLKAASAVKSRAATILGEDSGDGCVQNPWPKDGPSSDVVVGAEESERIPGQCGVEKSGEEERDEVVVVGGHGEGGIDDVVVGGEVEGLGEKGGGCVEGVKGSGSGVGDGIGIGSKEGGKVADEAEEGENEGEKPILAEGFV